MTNKHFSAKLSFLVVRSAMHIGCGESLGDVDQPVVRNEVTRHPCVPRSALKRSLKDGLTESLEQGGIIDALFGTKDGKTGMLCPQEGQLLMLPVACRAGGPAWITSPSVLVRMARQARSCGIVLPDAEMPAARPAALAAGLAVDIALAPADSPLRQRMGDVQYVGLADLWLLSDPVEPDTEKGKVLRLWANWLARNAFAADDADWRALVADRLVVVHDMVFDALAERLSVRARNVIGDDGRADNLWREESVPDDAVFYAVLAAQPLPQHCKVFANGAEALAALPDHVNLQVGGNASLGQGFTDCVVLAAPQHGEQDD